MTDDSSVVVKIVGDASAVQPAVDETAGSLGGIETVIAGIGGWVDQLIAKFTEMGTVGAASGTAIAGGLEKATVAATGASAKIGEMSERLHVGGLSVGIFEKAFAPLVEIIAAAFAIDKVAEFINKMAEGAEKVVHLSQQFGMSVTEVQQLQGIATATGVPIDALTKGMGMLDRNMANAAMGAHNVKQAMDAVGISLNDGRSQMEKLEEVADKFANMADGPKKVALAMQLFGRSGKELIPVLNLGSDGIAQLNQKMDEYGVRNEAAVEAGAKLAENVNETKLGFMGVENVLTQALAPAFTIIVEGVNELIQAFVESYQQGGIVADILGVVSGAIQIAGQVFEALGSIFSDVWTVIVQVVTDIWQVVEQVFGIQIPKNVNVAKLVFTELKNAIEIVKDGILLFVDSAGAAIEALAQTLVAFGKVAWDAFHLDWGAIQGDWNKGMDAVVAIVHRAAAKIQADAKAMGDAIAAAMQGKAAPGTEGTGGGLKLPKAGGDFDYNPTGKAKKAKKPKDDIVEKLKEELEAKKDAWDQEQVAQDQAQEFSLQSIADFWAKAKELTNLSAKDKLKIENEFVKAEQDVQKEAEEQKLTAMKRGIEADGADYKKKLADLAAYVAEVKRFYGDKSKQAEAAEKEAADAAKKAAEDSKKAWQEYFTAVRTLELGQITDEENQAKFEVEMGIKSKSELLANQKDFENRRYAVALEGLQQRLELDKQDPNTNAATLQKDFDEIEALWQQHENKVNEIDRQATLQRTQIERNGIDVFASSFAQAISKMVTLQASFSATLKSLWQGIQQAIGQVLEQILEKFIATEVMKLIFGKQTAQGEIAAEAAKAGAGGVASMAAAPYPMDMTAPAFGAKMAADAMAFSSLNIAEGGDWNVDPGLYMLHQKEMVLPAWAAEGVRDMIGSGGAPNSNGPVGSGMGSSPGGDVHLHYSPNISQGGQPNLRQMLANGGGDMLNWINQAVRDGKLKLQPA